MGRIASERRITDEQVARLDQAIEAAKDAAALALSSAEKAQEKHNELIRKGENERAEFARADEVDRLRDLISQVSTAQARIAGASVVGSVCLAVLINLILRLSGVGS